MIYELLLLKQVLMETELTLQSLVFLTESYVVNCVGEMVTVTAFWAILKVTST